MAQVRKHLVGERGVTLFELLAVLLVLGILLAIAVPSYIAMSTRADQAAAKENVHSALPAVEAYRADCGKYADAAASECADGVAHTFDVSGLQRYAIGLKLLTVKSLAGGTSYCIDAQVGGKTASITGAGGSIATTRCP